MTIPLAAGPPADAPFGLPLHSVHTDEEMYPNADESDGFRFFMLREKEGDDVLAAKHQLVYYIS